MRIEAGLKFFCSSPYSPDDILFAKIVLRLPLWWYKICGISRSQIIYELVK